ncbi:hypothetical protein D3C80_2013850 [compost metagenome]
MYAESILSDMGDTLPCCFEICVGNRQIGVDLFEHTTDARISGQLDVLVVAHMVVHSVLMDVGPARPLGDI